MASAVFARSLAEGPALDADACAQSEDPMKASSPFIRRINRKLPAGQRLCIITRMRTGYQRWGIVQRHPNHALVADRINPRTIAKRLGVALRGRKVVA